MIAFRKGRKCRVEHIDRLIDPPSVTVFMFDTKGTVETEFEFLSLEDPNPKKEEITAETDGTNNEANLVEKETDASQCEETGDQTTPKANDALGEGSEDPKL